MTGENPRLRLQETRPGLLRDRRCKPCKSPSRRTFATVLHRASSRRCSRCIWRLPSAATSMGRVRPQRPYIDRRTHRGKRDRSRRLSQERHWLDSANQKETRTAGQPMHRKRQPSFASFPPRLPPPIESTYVPWNLYQMQCGRATARWGGYLHDPAIRQRHFLNPGHSCASVPNFGPRQISTPIPFSSA